MNLLHAASSSTLLFLGSRGQGLNYCKELQWDWGNGSVTEHLSHKPKDLTSKSQNTHKEPDVLAHIWNPIIPTVRWKVKTRESPRSSNASYLEYTAQWQETRQTNCPLHVLQHTHPHTCAQSSTLNIGT